MKVLDGIPQRWGLSTVGFGSFAHVGESAQKQRRSGVNWSISLEMNRQCLLACKHCIYPDRAEGSGNSVILTFDLLLGNIAEACRSPFGPPVLASVAGKEPAIFVRDHPDSFRCLEQVLGEAGACRIMMTSGLLLDRQQWVAEHLDCLDVSLDGDRESHDAMRGDGMFGKSWGNILAVSKKFKKVGLIATATADTLAGIPRLQRLLADTFPPDGNVSLSVAFFYGPSGAALDANYRMLSADEIVGLLGELREGQFPVRVLWTANVAHMTDEVLGRLGCTIGSDLAVDQLTGISHVRFGVLHFILFNLATERNVAIRVSADGQVFIGCNHIAFERDMSRWAVGDLSAGDRLVNILERTLNSAPEDAAWYTRLSHPPQECVGRSCFALCRGGDAISGWYLGKEGKDPFCQKIN